MIERIGNIGTLCIISSDVSIPEIHLRHIKNAKLVKDVISQSVEISRRENGVRTSELMGSPSGNDSFGPELMPDFNGNGVDDRTE